MADHYDTALASMRETLDAAKRQAATGDIFAEFDVEWITGALADLEREAAVHRAKTPEQLAVEDAAGEAKWSAFQEACDAKEAAGDDADDDDLDDDGDDD